MTYLYTPLDILLRIEKNINTPKHISKPMSKPTIDWDNKKLHYEGIIYQITGTDRKQLCIVGENTDHNLHIIYWTHRTEKKIKDAATGYAIQGLSRDDCLVLDATAYTTLSSAILEYEEYCGTPQKEDTN
jgi:hypothetical protein